MKQWMLSVHHEEGEAMPPQEQLQQMFADVEAFNGDLQAAGAWVFACGLEAPDLATVVRNEGGDVVTTDGPFAESREHLGGFWVIKAPDHAAALDWAARGGPGGVRRGVANLARPRPAAQPGRLDHDHGPPPRDRPSPARVAA